MVNKSNDIRDIKTVKQLEKVELNFDSPRLKQAMSNLGVSKEDVSKK